MKVRLLCILFLLELLSTSCAKESSEILDISSEGPSVTHPGQYIVTAGADVNHYGIGIYNLDGEMVNSTHFRREDAAPRGLAVRDETSVYISLDTSDSIYSLDIDGTKTLFHGSSQLSGNIFGIVKTEDGHVYVVESNLIEAFGPDGTRLPLRAIPTTLGGCVLSTPRGMTINSLGQLLVVNQGGADNLLIYDISGPTATCVSSVAIGNNPYSLIEHSNGYLYITTQGNDQIIRTDPDGSNQTVIWSTNLSVLNDPTGLLELPNGDLLVSSSVTDTIERITLTGQRVGDVPFIRDSMSMNVSDLVLVGEAASD